MNRKNPSQSEVRRVTPELRLAAAGRLCEGQGIDPADAGARFLARAADHGIDLDLFWAVSPDGRRVRQAALVVSQPGRTAMFFLSGVGSSLRCGDRQAQHVDRVAVIQAAIDEAPVILGDRLHLLQALPSPEEWWATEAFAGAGMTRLGDLAYLKRPLALSAKQGHAAAWPEGVEVRAVRGLEQHLDGPDLRAALERTYHDTLDCPGLCDMRETVDVIESHRATGRFDPSLWWIVYSEGRPEGCVLLTPSPEQDSVELVYMGLGPALRGRGLGSSLLEAGIARAQRCRLNDLTCAVDYKNEPARTMYAKLGFTEFAHRIAYVQTTRPST